MLTAKPPAGSGSGSSGVNYWSSQSTPSRLVVWWGSLMPLGSGHLLHEYYRLSREIVDGCIREHDRCACGTVRDVTYYSGATP